MCQLLGLVPPDLLTQLPVLVLQQYKQYKQYQNVLEAVPEQSDVPIKFKPRAT